MHALRKETRSPISFTQRSACAALLTVGAAVALAQAAPSLPSVSAKTPDLVVQRIEYMDCVPRVGVTLYNQGATAVASTFAVRLTATGNAGARNAFQSIGGIGGFSTARLVFELAPEDTYVAYVDSKDAVKEASEANNELRAVARNLVRCPSVFVANASATEGQPLRFPVRLSHAFSQPITVRFATADGTALGADFGLLAGNGTTACGADYIRATGVLEFPAGTSQLTQIVAISSCLDDAAENAETLSLRITEVINGTSAVGASGAPGTILDHAP